MIPSFYGRYDNFTADIAQPSLDAVKSETMAAELFRCLKDVTKNPISIYRQFGALLEPEISDSLPPRKLVPVNERTLKWDNEISSRVFMLSLRDVDGKKSPIATINP